MKITENCSEVLGALPLYVGGDLDPSELESVMAHLRLCPDCRAEEQLLQRSRERLAALHQSTSPPPALWPGLRAELQRAGLFGTRSAGTTGGRAGGRLLRFLPRVAAAGLLLAAGVWAGLAWQERSQSTDRLPDGGAVVVEVQPVADRKVVPLMALEEHEKPLHLLAEEVQSAQPSSPAVLVGGEAAGNVYEPPVQSQRRRVR